MGKMTDKLKGIFSKKKNVDAAKEIHNSVKKDIKLFKERDLVKETLDKIEAKTIDSLTEIPTSKTFVRLDTLELGATWATTAILDNQQQINAIKEQHQKDVDAINERLDKIKPNELKADVVLDTTDNIYKNVKDIIINQSIKANTILYKGAYQTLESVVSTITNPDSVAHADYADVATMVIYQAAPRSLTDVLDDYVSKAALLNVANNSTSFDDFLARLKGICI